VTNISDENDEPIKHHYVMVLVVEALTVTALFLLSRFYR
jgi:hypothetical protein